MAEYEISDDPGRLDLDVAHDYLTSEAYWSAGIPRDVFDRAVAHSLCFGVYHDSGMMVGFARVVTDSATFAWLCDLFILDGHRGHGLGKRLVQAVHDHPDLQGLRRMMLATRDAHELYRRFGYAQVNADTGMEITRPSRDLYRTPAQ